MEFGTQFYPTPDDLACKLASKIDWTNVKTILEPSVGKGDLLQYLRYKRHELQCSPNMDLYGFEIDLNLRRIVKEDCTLLGFNFLEYEENHINFDVIIMNPPFKDGADHLLKAWDILKHGQIACILNAQTLKNPFSKKRKEVLKIIEEYGEVEYITGAFEEAERETSVEVAIVYLKKKGNISDNMFSGFKDSMREDYSSLFEGVPENEVLLSGGVEGLLAFNRILKKQLIETTNSQMKMGHYMKTFGTAINSKYLDRLGGLSDSEGREQINSGVKSVNRTCWGIFFENNSTIRDKVTRKVYSKFISEYSNSAMDFTQRNIDFVTTAIMGSLGDIFTENVLDLFDLFCQYNFETLGEYSSGRKTNTGWKLGMRAILPNYTKDNYSNGITLSYDKEAELYEIEKVFNTLLGKSNISTVGHIGNEHSLEPRKWYSTEYFDIKFFKNGNAHFKFTNEDIVKKFNYEAAKGKKWIHN